MDTSQINHRFTGADLMLKVFAQAPIAAQPSEGPFYDPPARDHHKALRIGGSAGNLQYPPTVMLDPPPDPFIAPIGPDELQATPAIVDTTFDAHKEFPQEPLASRAVGDAGTMHYHQHEQSQDIHHDMAFASSDWFMDIGSSLFPTFGCLDALAVDTGPTGLGLSARLPSHGGDQRRVKLAPQTAVAPAPVIPIHGLPRRKVVGQQSPRLPTTYEVEDGMQDLAVRPGPRATPGTRELGKLDSNAAPLFLIQIRWVCASALEFNPPTLSAPFIKHSLSGQSQQKRRQLFGVSWAVVCLVAGPVAGGWDRSPVLFQCQFPWRCSTAGTPRP